MKFFEKFTSKPEQVEAETKIINSVEIDSLQPEEQEALKQINDHITNITKGLTSSRKTEVGSWKETTTLEDKQLVVSYFNGAGIGYSSGVTFQDKDIRVELSSGADFDTTLKYSTISIEDIQSEAETPAMKLEINDAGRVTVTNGDIESTSAAAANVLNVLGSSLSEVSAKGVRS